MRVHLIAAGLAAASPAAAQTAAGDAPVAAQPGARTTTYDAAFFAQYAPATALDIARRVPGFNLDLGDGGVRGFAGAAGNVVFNGARPSSKSDSLETLLARIPASRVLRVEIGPGDIYGSDYAGKSQVLNVVLKAGGGIDGNVSLKATRVWDGSIIPNAEGSVLFKRGAFSANLAAGTNRGDSLEEGYDLITNAVTGAQVEYREKVNRYHPHDPYVSLNLGLETAPDRSAHLNGRYAPSKFDLLQTNLVTPASGPDRDDRLIQNYDDTVIEVGGDLTRPLAGGAIKLVALATRRSRATYDASFNRVGTTVVGGFEQLTDSKYQETLAKLNWTRAKLLGLSFEIGSEVAFNRLDNNTDLLLIDGAGVRTRVDLPVDEARVQEWRTNSYVNAGREVAKGLRLDAGLAFETSSLTVSGDTTARRSLRFLKPSLTVDFQPAGGWHFQAIARRTISQLDFYDFIANAELSNSRVNGGNADLQPQRSWELRGTIERPILGAGLAKLDVGYDRVSLLQDRILTSDGFDAPGNIGTGTRWFAQLTLDAPLDRLGLKGFRVRADGTLQQTRVRDPLSGQVRNWSDFWPDWRWSLDLRRDATNWAAGVSFFDRDRFAFFRTDEIDSQFNGAIYVTAFAEYRPDKRTSIRLDVENATNVTGNRLRVFYAPDRSNPTPFLNEFRERNSHVAVSLTLRRTFGGGGAAK